MGWQVKIKKNKKQETKYRLWTTVADGWITKWSTKEEIVEFLFWHRFEKFMESFLEDAMTFPNGYTDKDSYKYIEGDKKDVDAYYKFMNSRFSNKGKNYMEMTADKFKEIITQLGIEVSVKDSKGHNFK